MGNILSYNRNTNELVARNSTPTRIVRYIYKFTLYDVNFSSEHMYYTANDWIVTSTGVQELRLGYAFNVSSIKTIYKFTLKSVPFQASNVTVSNDWTVSSVSDGNSLYNVTFEYKPSGTPTNLDLTSPYTEMLVASLDATITQVYGNTTIEWWTDKDDTNSSVTTTINNTTLTVKSLSSRNVTFTYDGSEGETDNKYYTLNIAPNEAFKIAQFARLANLDDNSTNLNYETKFTWVSKQALDGVTINEDEYDNTLGDLATRDYAIVFVTLNNYIEKRLIDYKPNLGEIYINYDANSGMASLYQICISNVNPIGAGPSYSNYGQEFYYVNPSWTVTKSTSPYDSTNIDYLFTYNGGGSYVFNGNEQILLARFYQTVNQKSSNINDTTYVLSIEQPLEGDNTIFNKTLIDKIHVNTIYNNDNEELQYAVTPLRYFKSQALLDYVKGNWTGLYNGYGLRSIELINVNIDENSLLAKTYLNGGDGSAGWTFSSQSTAPDDGTLTNLKMTGTDVSYWGSASSIVIFFKLLSRALANGLSNITDNTLVKLSLQNNSNSIVYEATGYFIDVSVSENVEYLGCQKMFNYNPMSGLLKYNGILDRITGFESFELLDVNLNTDSDYRSDSFAPDWSITADKDTVTNTGPVIYKDITITYGGTSSYTFTSNVVEHFCKFYKVSNQSSASNINMDTVVRIPIKDIPEPGKSVQQLAQRTGDVYIDLIHIGTGVEYWTRGRDINNNHINAGYIEYNGSKALFSVQNDPNVLNGEVLGTIKKFVIENVNANAACIFDRITETDWTTSSVGTGNTHTITAEYKSGTNDVTTLDGTNLDIYGNLDIFRLTRTATHDASSSNITSGTLIRVYRNYDEDDDEENYFVNLLLPDLSSEYIDGTSVIHYSKYDGTLSLLNNDDLGSVSSIEFFDVNVDTTSVYDTFNVDNKSVTVTSSSSSPYHDIKFTFSGTVTISNSSNFVRFNRLGSGIIINDLSDSNITDTTVFHFVQGTTVDAYLSLMSIADDDWEYEYYSKRNYIEYYANLGELRLRRSIIDTIYAVELVAINRDSVHFVNPDWTASFTHRIVRYSNGQNNNGQINVGIASNDPNINKIYKFVLKRVNFQASNVTESSDWTVSSVSVGNALFDVTFAYEPSGTPTTLDLSSSEILVASLSITIDDNTVVQIYDTINSTEPINEEIIYNGHYDLKLEYEPNNNRIVRYDNGQINVGYPSGGSSVKKIYKFVLKSVNFNASTSNITVSTGWSVSDISLENGLFDVTIAYEPSGTPTTLDLPSTEINVAIITIDNNTVVQIYDDISSTTPITEETTYNGPYVFPTEGGTVDDYVRLCTFYYDTTLSGIDTENTQVRLYIKDAISEVETENVINKTGEENDTSDNGINYYMKTGTIKLNQSLVRTEFRNLHRVVFYGVNVNAACIYSRTFAEVAAWNITTQTNFYNSDYVDLIITYTGATDYIVAGEVFLFQFFDTINRTFSNAGLIGSMASGSPKDAPVTWYSTRDITNEDYDTSPTAISGYFIGNPYVINVSAGYDAFNGYDATANSTEIKFTTEIIVESSPGTFTLQTTLYTVNIATNNYSNKNTFFNAVVNAMNDNVNGYPDGNFVFEDDKMISSYTKFNLVSSNLINDVIVGDGSTNNIAANPRDPDSYEYYSENARIFKYYNNRGVTEILAGQSSRINSVKSVTFLDVNFSQSQIYPSGTANDITVSSANADVYQDFTITFQSTHNTVQSIVTEELITVYDFYDVNLVDYLMNNNTIALVNDGITIFPIRTISAENPEYYKMDGIVNYYANNGDINFMKKTYNELSTSTVYKIEMENVNATTNEVIIVYGSWSVTSTRVGSLYTLRFTYVGDTSDDEGKYDTFVEGENFINIALLLGYYSSIYGSSLINKDTVVTVTFKSGSTSVDDIAKGKLVRLVSDPTEYDVTFTERTNYPVPSNLYTRYKEYNFLFLTGDGRKNGINTCISVFGRIVLTGTNGKTQEPTFEANASKVQMVRYTVLKSKTAPYDFSCEESGYTNFDVDATNIDLGDIGINFGPQKNIPSNSIVIRLMSNTLGNGNHTLYEILDSVIVVTISKYDGKSISPQVKKILEIYGTNFTTFKLTNGVCYMCVLFVNRKFETVNDLATFSRINRNDFTLSQREKNTVVYENLSGTKLVIVIPYAQMSTYMKYHYESIKHVGNTVRLPNAMILNAERTLKNYRKNSLVYNVDVLS